MESTESKGLNQNMQVRAMNLYQIKYTQLSQNWVFGAYEKEKVKLHFSYQINNLSKADTNKGQK